MCVLILVFPAVAHVALISAAVVGLPHLSEPPVQESPWGAGTTADLAFRQAGQRPQPEANTSPAALLSPVDRQPAKMERLLIPTINVDAPIVSRGRNEQGVMDAPPDAQTVAWYDFAGRPGTGSNSVLSGASRRRRHRPGSLLEPSQAALGDPIDIAMSDGTIYRYQLVSLKGYTLFDAPVDDIIGPTAYDAITLITCAGRFDPTLRAYEERLIVRARRATR